ncbi:MAG: fatty acid desaturase family protein [Gammaproteobacteria bacterium]
MLVLLQKNLPNRNLLINRYTRYQFAPSIIAEIKNLKTDNWHGILYIIKDYLIVSIFVALTYWLGWWFYPICICFIGAHQRGLASILHDAAHGVLAKNKLINFMLGTFPSGWLVFQSYYAYRKSHVYQHHPFLGHVDLDPDLKFFIKQEVFTPMSNKTYLWKIIIMPMLGGKIWVYIKYLAKNRYQILKQKTLNPDLIINKKIYSTRSWKHYFDRRGFTAFWLSIIITAVIYDFWQELILFWIIPYLTVFHIIGWFVELSEHCSCERKQSVNLYMARNRRSRHLEKWLTAINGDQYHLDHHLNPATPFWLLHKAHQIRMRDSNYAAHCQQTGGLFQKGKNGAPSIIKYMYQRHSETHCTSKGKKHCHPEPLCEAKRVEGSPGTCCED